MHLSPVLQRERAKWRTFRQVAKAGGVGLLLLTVAANIWFLMDTASQLRQHQEVHHSGRRLVAKADRRLEVKSRSEQRQKEPVGDLSIVVVSSKARVSVTVDDKVVVQAVGAGDNERGIHVVILHPSTGRLMAHQVFDTYMDKMGEALILFLNTITSGRIICLAIKDEGTFSLKGPARDGLKALGSTSAGNLAWRDMWALVSYKHGRSVGEQHHRSASLDQWADPVVLSVTTPRVAMRDTSCHWPSSEENTRRQNFCSKYEGYLSLCHCTNPSPLFLRPEPLHGSRVVDVPVAIVASNRPHYLFRMLRTLTSTPGADPSMVTVFIDGHFEEPADVARLFGLRAVSHTPVSEKNARISQHYKASFIGVFNLYPSAEFAIIIEEDLDVAPDFFSFFSQTIHLLREDPTIYCISAWNDQGYEHSAKDPSLLYRVETMPGLGWLLKRSLFKNELELRWPTPDKYWDWDMWMRTSGVRKGRECVIPDVSRTYHFGSSGLNMNPYFQDAYFNKHKVNVMPNIKLKDVNSLRAQDYEIVIHGLLKHAILLNHTASPCSNDFIPKSKDVIYLMYIQMKVENDFQTWMQIAKCFKLWDLDARGFHKGLWRFWLKENHILVMGTPYSPYSKKFPLPSNVKPIFIPKPTEAKKEAVPKKAAESKRSV